MCVYANVNRKINFSSVIYIDDYLSACRCLVPKGIRGNCTVNPQRESRNIDQSGTIARNRKKKLASAI